MKKEPKLVVLHIGGRIFKCDWCEPGYWLGEVSCGNGYAEGTLDLHVEVIRVKQPRWRATASDTPNFATAYATNEDYQNRLDSWHERNPGKDPTLLVVPGVGKCFINIEVFAR